MSALFACQLDTTRLGAVGFLVALRAAIKSSLSEAYARGNEAKDLCVLVNFTGPAVVELRTRATARAVAVAVLPSPLAEEAVAALDQADTNEGIRILLSSGESFETLLAPIHFKETPWPTGSH